ncbi:DNA-directed RNA polymerase, omega subunit family protein, partial [Reticulomyxa filosa]
QEEEKKREEKIKEEQRKLEEQKKKEEEKARELNKGANKQRMAETRRTIALKFGKLLENETRGKKLEELVFRVCNDVNDAYKDKSRDILFNLDKNAVLLQDVKNKILTVNCPANTCIEMFHNVLIYTFVQSPKELHEERKKRDKESEQMHTLESKPVFGDISYKDFSQVTLSDQGDVVERKQLETDQHHVTISGDLDAHGIIVSNDTFGNNPNSVSTNININNHHPNTSSLLSSNVTTALSSVDNKTNDAIQHSDLYHSNGHKNEILTLKQTALSESNKYSQNPVIDNSTPLSRLINHQEDQNHCEIVHNKKFTDEYLDNKSLQIHSNNARSSFPTVCQDNNPTQFEKEDDHIIVISKTSSDEDEDDILLLHEVNHIETFSSATSENDVCTFERPPKLKKEKFVKTTTHSKKAKKIQKQHKHKHKQNIENNPRQDKKRKPEGTSNEIKDISSIHPSRLQLFNHLTAEWNGVLNYSTKVKSIQAKIMIKKIGSIDDNSKNSDDNDWVHCLPQVLNFNGTIQYKKFNESIPIFYSTSKRKKLLLMEMLGHDSDLSTIITDLQSKERCGVIDMKQTNKFKLYIIPPQAKICENISKIFENQPTNQNMQGLALQYFYFDTLADFNLVVSFLLVTMENGQF